MGNSTFNDSQRRYRRRRTLCADVGRVPVRPMRPPPPALIGKARLLTRCNTARRGKNGVAAVYLCNTKGSGAFGRVSF
jgi:hypothetical protein